MLTHHKRNGTKTSAFGSSGRINHDSLKFYNSKLYERLNNSKNVEYVEKPIGQQYINKIFYKSLEFIKSVWKFPPERDPKAGHPAPFPIELPYRLIQLYTFENEIVLDPFAGSGSICIAALKTNRKYIGYEIDKKYCDLAE